MDELEEHVYRRVTDGISPVPVTERGETYVVSLWVTDESDDPRLPAVRVGHNTESAAQAAADSASSELEARWNFAFLLAGRTRVHQRQRGGPGRREAAP